MNDVTQERSQRRWARPRPLAAALRGIELVELTVGALLLAAIVVLVMMQVLARVTPLDNQVWTGELAKFSLVWLSFGLAGYLLGRDEHITLDVVDHVLPSLGQQLVKVFSLLVVAATSAAFAYEGYDLFSSDSPIKSPATGIPLGWIYFIPLAGMVLTVLRSLVEIVFPTSHEGQIRIAGEVIADESEVDETGGPTPTREVLHEVPSPEPKESVR